MKDKFTPSTATNIETTNELNTPYGTGIYVFADDTKWDVTQQLMKLNPGSDGSGVLYIETKHKETVINLCDARNIVYEEGPLPQPIEFLRKNYLSFALEQRLSYFEKLIRLGTSKLGIVCHDVEELLDDDHRKKLEKNKEGLGVLNYLGKYLATKKNIRWIENAKLSKEYSNQSAIIDNQFDYLLKNNSRQQLINDLQNISPGIDTGYKIGDVDLIFPGGAISIIAAPTSHGKTTALINFTLSALEKNPDKTAYFFTYEESMASIMLLFVNTWVSKKLSKNSIPQISKNNKRSIESYFRGNTADFISSNAKDIFPKYEERFFSELIDTGRLKVIQSDMPSNELIQAIQHIKKNTNNLGIVCIDYMQLLKLTTNNRLSRQEELKEICLNLKDCAISTGLPIVLAAQFNRTVTTEGDLSPVNIGEAGDIERIASLIIGMFNRNFEMTKEGNKGRDGTVITKESTIYFEILKGRSIGNGHHSVMKFNGNSGTIINNQKENNNPFE